MRGLWLILALLAGAALAWSAIVEPRPTLVGEPADAFSSGRAMADVRIVAARPHPVGSPENRRVRDYLVARLRSLGLETDVQRHRVDGGPRGVVAVENIVAVLPGQNCAT